MWHTLILCQNQIFFYLMTDRRLLNLRPHKLWQPPEASHLIVNILLIHWGNEVDYEKITSNKKS